MLTVHKYSLEIADYQIVELPYGAQILDIQPQQDALKLWAIVNSEFIPNIQRIIILAGTGFKLPHGNLKHISTMQISRLVFHAFEDIGGRDG